MGDLSEFSLGIRMFLKTYRWRRIDPIPWAPPRRPLAESRLVLISSAGMVASGQKPFDDHVRGGDWSFRKIPAGIDPATLRDTHRSDSFDHTGLQADPNLAFPLTRADELAEQGTIGSVNHRHFSVMGSITAPGRFVKETCPALATACVEDQVDVALLVPV